MEGLTQSYMLEQKLLSCEPIDLRYSDVTLPYLLISVGLSLTSGTDI